jgi:hypothetical protein
MLVYDILRNRKSEINYVFYLIDPEIVELCVVFASATK